MRHHKRLRHFIESKSQIVWPRRCWGWNDDGQLGAGPHRPWSTFEPKMVSFENRGEYDFLEARVKNL
jgi:hypothetical protein